MKKLNKEKIFYIFQGESQLKAFMNLKEKFTLYRLPEKYPTVLVGEHTDKGDHFLRKMVEADAPFMSKTIQTAENNLDKEKLYYAQIMDTMGYKEGVHYAEIRESATVKITFPYHHVTSIKINNEKKLLFADQNGTIVYTLMADNYRLCSSYEFYTVFVNNALYNKITKQGKGNKNERSKTPAHNKKEVKQ